MKNKFNDLIKSKIEEGTSFKSDVGAVLKDAKLSKTVTEDFLDVSEALMVKFARELGESCLDALSEDLKVKQDEISKIDEQKELILAKAMTEADELKEAKVKELDEHAAEYANLLDEGAKAYADNIQEELDKEVAKKLQEKSDTLNSYMEHAAESFMLENKVEIESNIKAGLTESLMEGLTKLYESNNLVVPAEIDVVHELEDSLTESEQSIDKLLNINENLREKVKLNERKLALQEKTKSLSVSQREKVEKILEKVEITSSDEYSNKIDSICEMIDGNPEYTELNPLNESTQEYNSSDVELSETVESDPMKMYIAAAKRIS